MSTHKHTYAEVFPPGEFIKDELEARGWSQADFAEIIGKSVRLVSEIVTAKRGVTPETAKVLAGAFGTSAEFWLNLESLYRLSKSAPVDGVVLRRARLFEKAPVAEMVKRGWIKQTGDIEVLEQEVLKFFRISQLDDEPKCLVAARAAKSASRDWTPAQVAWFCRAVELGAIVDVAKFTSSSAALGVEKLRPLLMDPEEARHVPKILAEVGIRFVVVEHTAGSRIDGATLWLSKDRPVIAMSLRYDRIDYFWHTLMHELGHIAAGHAAPGLDIDLGGREVDRTDWSEEEREVDRFATERLVPQKALEDFISRVAPLYSRDRIEAFAAKHAIHPGIVLGQLKHRHEVPWQNLTVLQVKVRSVIVGSALCDGWGSIVPLER